jgi:hypothetical protein
VLSLPTRPRAGLDSSRFRVCQNLLVDVERGHGYFDMAGFALGVEDELGRHDPGGDPPWPETPIRDRVLREAVAL